MGSQFSNFSWAYQDEWRGNKIDKHASYRVLGKEDTKARLLFLCTSDDIVKQIKLIANAVARECVEQAVPRAHVNEYSHVLYFPDGLGGVVKDAVQLLADVLSIRVNKFDVVIALGWYKIPPSDEVPHWRDTELGDLRSRAKFHGETSCRDELVSRMSDVVQRHELYGRCDAVLAVPGHDAFKTSCSEDLAERLAAAVGMPLVTVHCKSPLRPQAKEAHVDLTDEFSVRHDLSDLAVIVVDDTIQSGNSMRHVAIAARDAGARRVLGLTPVRNMKGS